MKKRVQKIVFFDEDGENIEEEDLQDYFESFTKLYCSFKKEPKEDFKVYTYKKEEDCLKMSCSHSSGKHLYNSSMNFSIVQSIVENSKNIKQKKNNKFFTNP